MAKNGTNVVGADGGYGWTKFITVENGVSVFRSLVAKAYDQQWSNDPRVSGGHRLQWGENDVFVGEMAAVYSRSPSTTRDRSRSTTFEANALLYGVLADAYPDGADNITVVTGLPIKWVNDAEQYRKNWLGKHSVSVDGTVRNWHIEDVMIAPQGFGALCDVVFHREGSKVTLAREDVWNGFTLVVDMGTLTMNLFAFKKGAYVGQLSTHNELGMSWAYQEVANLIDSVYGVDLEDHEVDQVIREGAIGIEGRTISTHELVTPVLLRLSQEQARTTRSLLGKTFRSVENVLVSGGGSHRLGSPYTRALDHSNSNVIPNAQGANARGFLNWGLVNKG
jgi:hypothetical protein